MKHLSYCTDYLYSVFCTQQLRVRKRLACGPTHSLRAVGAPLVARRLLACSQLALELLFQALRLLARRAAAHLRASPPAASGYRRTIEFLPMEFLSQALPRAKICQSMGTIACKRTTDYLSLSLWLAPPSVLAKRTSSERGARARYARYGRTLNTWIDTDEPQADRACRIFRQTTRTQHH